MTRADRIEAVSAVLSAAIRPGSVRLGDIAENIIDALDTLDELDDLVADGGVELPDDLA